MGDLALSEEQTVLLKEQPKAEGNLTGKEILLNLRKTCAGERALEKTLLS